MRIYTHCGPQVEMMSEAKTNLLNTGDSFKYVLVNVGFLLCDSESVRARVSPQPVCVAAAHLALTYLRSRDQADRKHSHQLTVT